MDYLLTSSNLQIGVKAHGAELFSIKSLKSGIEYMWQANPADWARHAPILFPIVGKLKDDTYTYNGAAYRLSQHGFARDQVFELVEMTDSSLVFELTSSDELKLLYPFDFTLSVGYHLQENRLNISYKVTNPGVVDLLYSVGAHPAFRIPIDPEAKRSDYEIVFSENESTPVHLIEGGLLSGQTEPLSLKKRKLQVTDGLFDKDALVFKGLSSKKLSLGKIGQSPFLNFLFDAPYFGIWSKSSTSEFICLEPWNGIADGIDHDKELTHKEGIQKLPPNETDTFSFSIEIVD